VAQSLVQSSERAFDAVRWRALAKPVSVLPGTLISLGFDGSRYHDATALIGTVMSTGFQFACGIWERPPNVLKWEVSKPAVDEAVAAAFKTYKVFRLYADPPFWEETVATWAGKYGEERVIAWWTNRRSRWRLPSAASTTRSSTAVSRTTGTRRCAHVGNAHKRPDHQRDDQDQPLWTIQKDRKDSPFKIDAAMAGILSWEARCHAVALGLGEKTESVYAKRGALVL
jgi:hypothetical protein